MQRDNNKPYRELTIEAVVLGILQGVILNIAFAYAALKLGFSIGGSTVAAIIGYALLRGVLKRGSAIENNINQTVASGINNAGTGVIFTLPALFMLNASWASSGYDLVEFSPWTFAIAGIAGSIIGVCVIVPLRKQMIDIDRLRFPTGVAVATIIRSGSTGKSKAKLLAYGVVASVLWKLFLLSETLAIENVIEGEEFHFGFGAIPDYFYPTIYLSLMNIAAGMLAGRGGLPFLFGGILAWWVVSPLAVSYDWIFVVADSGDIKSFIYGEMLKPLGIGALIGGAVMGVVVMMPVFKLAVTSVIRSSNLPSGDYNKQPADDEITFRPIIVGVMLATILLLFATLSVEGVSTSQAVIASLIGLAWIILASMIVAQSVGMTDVTPMSGMALISLTIMMYALDGNIAASMVVALTVCVAIGQGADMMQDLKTGFMVGSRPFKQQLVQISLAWTGTILSIGAVYVLWLGGPEGSGGFGVGTALPAPQGSVLMGVIEGISSGDVPVDKYILGGVVGAVLSASPITGLGILVALGIFMPFSITLGYGVGCLIQILIQRIKGAVFCENNIVPLAAGLIIGEALTGVTHAMFSIATNYYS